MKRLRLLTITVFILICVPVFFLGWNSLDRLEQEEKAELTFFCTALLDRIGAELDQLLLAEENHAVADFVPSGQLSATEPAFIRARAEIFTNGGMRLAVRAGIDSAQQKAWETALQNGRALEPAVQPDMASKDSKKEMAPPAQSLETKYFATSKAAPAPRAQQAPVLRKEKGALALNDNILAEADAEKRVLAKPQGLLEVEPFQTVILTGDSLFLYRRVQQDNRMLRQGIIVSGRDLLEYLLARTYRGQPIAEYAAIELGIANGSINLARIREGGSGASIFSQQQLMQRPFQFISADVEGLRLPSSQARASLLTALGCVVLALLGGFAALLRGAWLTEREAKRRSGFVSSVTHELKTPLANIRLYMEMLEQGMAPTPERERQYYTTLFSETDRLARLITNILEFSRLESKTRHLDTRLADPAPVFDKVRDILAPQLEKNGFTLAFHLAACACIHDPEALQQVLLNLAENSMKFGRTSETRQIDMACAPHGNNVVITVRDFGPGIPPQDIRRIFDDFYRCGDELTRTTTGTGIGLALVRRFVQAMGGTVDVKNNVDAGCTFTLVFRVHV